MFYFNSSIYYAALHGTHHVFQKSMSLFYLYTYLLSWAISAVDIENLLRNNIICLVVCRINTIFAV